MSKLQFESFELTKTERPSFWENKRVSFYETNIYKTRESNGIPSPTYFQLRCFHEDLIYLILNNPFNPKRQVGNILTQGFSFTFKPLEKYQITSWSFF